MRSNKGRLKTDTIGITVALFLLILFLGCMDKVDAEKNAGNLNFALKAREDEGKVIIRWAVSGIEPEKIKSIKLLRSTEDIGDIKPDPIWHPLVEIPLSPASDGIFEDKYFPQNCDLYYSLIVTDRRNTVSSSSPIKISSKDVAIPPLSNPNIHIDKINYVMNIRDGNAVKKRYPIALGRNPAKRKLHQDNATTPEGFYRIINEQPNALYYRAYDLNYPNDMDKLRYEFAMDRGLIEKVSGEFPGIGGEIQIHAKEERIRSNWSFGCIILTNQDIDQLFLHKDIKTGIPVIITGKEITPEDIKVLNNPWTGKEIKNFQKKLKKLGFNPGPFDGIFGRQTQYALGDLQIKKKIPVTCQLDSRTIKLLNQVRLEE